MCEVFERLKEIGVIKGRKCPHEGDCQKDTVPQDDFNPMTQCVLTSFVQLMQADLIEPSAEELIAKIPRKQLV